MKTVLVSAIMALILAAAGGILWAAGQAERRLSDVHHQLLTLQHAAVVSKDSSQEESLQSVSRVPGIGGALLKDARDERVVAEYWLGQYDALLPKRDASGVPVEPDPLVRFLGANAAYRVASHAEKGDKRATARALEGVMNNYADVLKSDPGQADAAYNYEYVARMRDAVAGPAKAQRAEKAPELWGEPSLHGRLGAPPKGTDKATFKMIVPKRKDEGRDDAQEAGTGRKKVRKG